MPSQFSPDQVVAAMVALGSKIPPFNGDAVDVAALGDADFNDKGDLVVQSLSARIRFVDASYAAKESQKTTYGAALNFAVLVYAENLRSRNDERMDSLRLAGQVQACYAGARLHLEDGSWTEPLELLTISPVMNADGVIDQYYGVTFRVPAIAQFPGSNARFGEK